MKKLFILLRLNKLVADKTLTAIALHIRNFMADFLRPFGICKDFAGNRVNELGNRPGCGVRY